MGLEMDQESIGIALVYVCVCEGDVGRLDCGFVLLHSIFYILYSKFYILSSSMIVVHGVVLRERTSLGDNQYRYWEARMLGCRGPY